MTVSTRSNETTPATQDGRYTGRHASPRGKKARNWRASKVLPAAAVAAAVVSGAAAYALNGGGQLQTAHVSAAMTLPARTAPASAPGADGISAAASRLVKVAQATASGRSRPAPRRAVAAPSATRRPSVARSVAPSVAPPASPSASAAAATHSAPVARSAAATVRRPAAAATLNCNLSYGLLPQNVTPIVSFLLAHGYSDNAAAGIAGNIYQESKGNPESEGMGGGGLIGWTPLPPGFVTGNVSADLQTQLSALLAYNQGWSSYLPALNAAASPADAAYIYVTDFERAGIPAAATREAAAADVAGACGI